MALAEQLGEYIDAAFTAIWIESHEQADALAEMAQLCRRERWRLLTWDIESGLRATGQSDAEPGTGGQDPLAAIRSLSALGSEDSAAILAQFELDSR